MRKADYDYRVGACDGGNASRHNFYRIGNREVAMNNTNHSNILADLYELILERKRNPEEGSYTCYLFEKGVDKILKKCGEECTEMVIATKNDDKTELSNEIADLFYHVLVLCAELELDWSEVEGVLRERRAKIGNLKTMRVTDTVS